MGISGGLLPVNFDRALAEYSKTNDLALQAAALAATDKARSVALSRMRSEMRSAGLGRLGNAISSQSDLTKRGSVFPLPGGGWRASGLIFLRTRSERTLGALESYTLGADIRPVRGRYLWLATDQIPKFVGRKRMTPELYNQGGFDRRIGPLVKVKSVNGRPLLIVRNVGVGALGQPRSARSLLKTGRARRGQLAKQFLVAFVGIPRTSREARVDLIAIARREHELLRERLFQFLGRI